MNKNKCVVYAPLNTYSGYGSRSREFIKALFDLKQNEWNIELIPCRWGSTRQGFIEDNFEEWGWLKEHFVSFPLSYKPDYMFWITVPNEAQPIGKWNCLVTAGIETTICDPEWIQGINRMDLTLVSSQHSKNTFLRSKYESKNTQTGEIEGTLKVNKPIEVLFEGVMKNMYFPIKWEE